MEYAHLGRSGMLVSRLCLGTYNFGTSTDEPEACRIMDAALEAGINFFDTANHYPDFVNCGRTESYIGRWLAQGGGRRERVILATKVSQPMRDPLDGPNDAPGLSAYKIRRHMEGSLRRLQTDRVELYQMHHVDRRATWDELWDVFQGLVQQGKAGYIGSSNFAGWHLAQAQAAARERHFFGLVSEQHRYNLACRLPELEVLPAAQALGIGVLPYSPLSGGLLAGLTADLPAASRREQSRGGFEPHQPMLAAYGEICREVGESLSTVAVAWLLSRPGVTSVILGPRTRGQLVESLRAVDVKLSAEILARLDKVFPAPGVAPEAYAW